jgi:bifunctional DNase/RNase
MNEVTVLGIAFDEANDVAAVILSREGAKKVVPIPIDINEGITVIRLLQKKKMPRPMTHDLMFNIIGDLHHKVQKVEIDLADSGQYIASVLVRGGDELLVEAAEEEDGDKWITLDARPFDAIAIAIKSEAPMFMSENAYEAHSVPLVMEQKGSGEKDDEFKDFVQNLKASDFNRIERPTAEPEEEPEGEPEEDTDD